VDEVFVEVGIFLATAECLHISAIENRELPFKIYGFTCKSIGNDHKIRAQQYFVGGV
jgi:hypothetical protein